MTKLTGGAVAGAGVAGVAPVPGEGPVAGGPKVPEAAVGVAGTVGADIVGQDQGTSGNRGRLSRRGESRYCVHNLAGQKAHNL